MNGQDENRGRRVLRAQAARHFQSVEVWQVHVEHQHIGAMRGDEAQRVRASRAFRDDGEVGRIVQHRAHSGADNGMIVYEDDGGHFTFPCAF